MSEPERFYIPSKLTIIEGFRVMRDAFEKMVKVKGRQLDPAWYDDGPESRPNLYRDRPETLTKGEST